MLVLVGHDPGRTCVPSSCAVRPRWKTPQILTCPSGSCPQRPLFLPWAVLRTHRYSISRRSQTQSFPCAVFCPSCFPGVRRLHVSAKLDNRYNFTHREMDVGAVADVFVFETLSCPAPSTRLPTDNKDDPLTANLVAERSNDFVRRSPRRGVRTRSSPFRGLSMLTLRICWSLPRDLERGLVCHVQADLDRHPSSVYTPLDSEIKADVCAHRCPRFFCVRFAET